MKSFRLVAASEGPRREFKITLGLRAGYGSAGRIYDLEEAVRTAHRWMRERAAQGEPFLSGMFTRGEVVYADSGGEAASHREPVAIFAGERSSRNMPATLMTAPSASFSTNWPKKWAGLSNRRRCISPIENGRGR